MKVIESLGEVLESFGGWVVMGLWCVGTNTPRWQNLEKASKTPPPCKAGEYLCWIS